jgi:hypothetical protein
MKKRKISLLTIDEKIANFFINELNTIFNNMLEIELMFACNVGILFVAMGCIR